MRIGIFSILIVTALAPAVIGQNFLSEELSPRALSLGGAVVALADDASAALWNPAGLFTLKGFRFLGRLSMPLETASFDISGVALSGGWLSFGGAFWYGSKEIRAPISGAQSLIVIAAGAGVREMMAAGIAVKLYDELQADRSFHGTGVDIGLLARFGSVFQGGLSVTDVLGTRLIAREHAVIEIPLIVRMGAALKLWEERVRLLGTLDLARQEQARTIRLGVEFWIFEGMALRLGWNGRALFWGAGLGILKSLQSDFAWYADGWALSIEISFGSR